MYKDFVFVTVNFETQYLFFRLISSLSSLLGLFKGLLQHPFRENAKDMPPVFLGCVNVGNRLSFF